MKFVWFFKLIGGEILKILIWALKLLVWVRVIPNVVRIPQYLVFNFTHVSWLALDDSTHPTPVKTSRPTWPGVEASRRRVRRVFPKVSSGEKTLSRRPRAGL